jgi:RNA recognition motif-containing protein
LSAVGSTSVRIFRPKTATSEIYASPEAGHIRRSSQAQWADTEVTKLYVGNLPFDATDESVRALFAVHGAVEKLSLVTDRDSGRPRGFGFVEMSNADAARAMQALNGADFAGRSLRVNEAQARTGGGGGDRGPRRY